MKEYIAPLEKLIEQFQSFPGVGRKSATRLAFKVLDFTEEKAQEFAEAIVEAKTKIHDCAQCFNFSSDELCNICTDETRDHSIICIVEDTKSLMAIEKVKDFNGVYHVLKGKISPMDGIGPDQLKIQELLDRVNEGGVKEIILATNSTIEGENTAMYLTHIIKKYSDIKITRLAYGIPVGGDLEYADEVTLFRALEGRRELV